METRQNDRISPLWLPPAGTSSRPLVEKELHDLPAELLTVLLHDLRSPLGAIGVLADLLSSVSQSGQPAEPRQVSLLQDAVNKAQRMLDDAVEVQSVIRGSSTFMSGIIESGILVRTSLEKASHASYFRNVRVDYNPANGEAMIFTDIEKAETVLLCALEHSIVEPEHQTPISVYHSRQPGSSIIHIVNEQPQSYLEKSQEQKSSPPRKLKGRLGTRRLGESRYSLSVCGRVMTLMGGKLEESSGSFGRMISIYFPDSAT